MSTLELVKKLWPCAKFLRTRAGAERRLARVRLWMEGSLSSAELAVLQVGEREFLPVAWVGPDFCHHLCLVDAGVAVSNSPALLEAIR